VETTKPNKGKIKEGKPPHASFSYIFFTRKICGNHPAERKKEEQNFIGLSPRNMRACHSISIALLQSIAKIRT
jgi:hypothetical protein